MQGRLLTGRRRRRFLALIGAALVAIAGGVAPARAATVPSCGTRLSAHLAAFGSQHPDVRLAIAVHDLTNGRYYGYRRHIRQITASIVKVEILEALLHRHPGGLPPRLSAIATQMIEESDNDDAQLLYDRLGDAQGLARFGRLVGLQETEPGGGVGPGYYWGLTLTTPADQLRLLALLAADNAILSHGDRLYELRLMRHVDPYQRWGITTGTGDSLVAVKDGWLAVSDGWQINSIGYVKGASGRYLIAIQSNGAATMSAGVHLVNMASRVVAKHC
jgi:hypothetical protein